MAGVMFDLTPFTSRQAKQQARTIVIQRVEVNYRLALILLVALVPAVVVAGALWPLLHELGLFMVPITLTAGWWFFYRRDRNGLKLRTYQSMKDRISARSGDLYVAGKPVRVEAADLRILVRNSIPVMDVATAGGHLDPDLVGELFTSPEPANTGLDLEVPEWEPLYQQVHTIDVGGGR